MFYLNQTHNLISIENDLDPKNYTEKTQIIIIDKTLENSIKPYPIIEKNKIFKYKNLEITLESCWKSPKNSDENSAMILVNEIIPQKRRIKNNVKNNQNPDEQEQYEIENSKIKKIFHGWIFSQNRSISHLEHEIYQIYLDSCI
jgi:hypothetical protein